MSEPTDTDEPDTDDGEPAEQKPSRPRKKRKKKKRKPAKTTSAAPESSAADADGHPPPPPSEEEPADAPLPGEGTADGDRLRAAHRSFEVGDYASVRKQTRALEETAGPEVAAAARALRKRVDIDPVQVVVLSCCAAVVGAIMYVWIL